MSIQKRKHKNIKQKHYIKHNYTKHNYNKHNYTKHNYIITITTLQLQSNTSLNNIHKPLTTTSTLVHNGTYLTTSYPNDGDSVNHCVFV